jgi:hypothetical protein
MVVVTSPCLRWGFLRLHVTKGYLFAHATAGTSLSLVARTAWAATETVDDGTRRATTQRFCALAIISAGANIARTATRNVCVRHGYKCYFPYPTILPVGIQQRRAWDRRSETNTFCTPTRALTAPPTGASTWRTCDLGVIFR